MPVLLPAWLTGAADAMRRLADRPWTLFYLLLALNAIARPASTTAHDARLYSLQVLNQSEAGAYGDDIFLRYGSQDQFSLFSRIVGPMVAAFGVRSAFFLLYLVFDALFIFALFRLVRALIDDALIATLALMFLVTAPLPYGGGDIFTVQEQFFTPRIIATAFTLFALERTLNRHFVQALGLLIVATVIHPLMAFGGVMICAGYAAWTLLPTWLSATALVLSGVSGVAVLATPAFGTRLFGSIDDDWHQLIRIAVGYNYPDTWEIKAWINLALSFAVPIAACCTIYRDDPVRRRFVSVVVAAGVIGFLATVAASMLPYALLFQGQPYRVQWILKVLQVPLGFLLIARWSQSSALFPRLSALVLIGSFCVVNGIVPELLIFAMALPISIFICLLADEPGGWWYGAARGFVLGALGWMAWRWWYFANQYALIGKYFDLNEWVLFDLVSPIFLLVAICVIAWRWREAANFAAVRWAGVAAALVVPLALFATEISPGFQRDHTRLGADIAFVRDFVRQRETPDGHRPCVYLPFNRPDLLWIDVQATSYFSIIQTAGVMFNRQTALEIDRRSRIVAPFEMARQRDEMLFPDEGKKVAMQNLYKVDFDCPAPTRDDLVRLCQEPRLDYVVIPQEFAELYSATNGRVFVYECYKVRNASSFSVRNAGSATPFLAAPTER